MEDKEDNYTIRQRLINANIGLIELLNISFVIFKSQINTFLIVILLFGVPLNLAETLYPIPVIDFSNLNLFSHSFHLLLNTIFSSLQIAAITFIVKKSILNRYVDASYAVLFSIKKFPRVFLTYIMFFLFVLLGTAALVIPGIIIYILFSLSSYVASAREEYGISALKYTFNLVKKNTMKVFLTVVFIILFQLSFAVVMGSYVFGNGVYDFIYKIIVYLFMHILTGYLTTLAAVLFFHFEYNYGKLVNKRK